MSVKLPWGQSTIAWGSSLCNGLVGSWLFNERAGSNAYSGVNPNDILAIASVNVLNGGFWLCGYKPAWNLGYRFRKPSGGVAYASLASPSAALKPANAVSLFWRGTCFSDGSLGNNPAIAGMTYTSSNTSPYNAYGIFRVNGAPASLYFLDDAGASNAQLVAGVIPTYQTTFDACITVKNGGNAVGYVNGSQVCSAARSGAMTYATSALLMGTDWVSGLGAETTDQATDVLYIWNRQLSPAEVMFLHANPYAVLGPLPEWIQERKYTPPPNAPPLTVPVDYQPFLAQ